MIRRELLQALGLAVVVRDRPFWTALMGMSDKKALLALFDRVGIDVDDPSYDETPNAVSVRVNGSEVTGTEGGMVVFKFTPHGALSGMVVWNKDMSNVKDSQ